MFIVRKTDDSGQDDDSVSIISNDIDEAEEESEQIQYNNSDRHLFGIRRRRSKVVEKNSHVDGIETAKDALDDLQLNSNDLEMITHNCLEIESSKLRDKVKYALFVLFGITGCYLSYRFISMYIVSLTFSKVNIILILHNKVYKKIYILVLLLIKIGLSFIHNV